MKKYFVFGVVFLKIIVFQIFASSPDTIVDAADSVSIATNDYRFTISFPNKEIMAGDKIIMTTVLENISTNISTVVLASPLAIYQIHVTSLNGQEVPMTLYGNKLLMVAASGGSITKQNLNPGERIAKSFVINRLFDMSRAGNYAITVSRWVRIHGDHKAAIITAPPVKIDLQENE